MTLVLNLTKTSVSLERLESQFYGYIFSKKGLMPTGEKIRAIKECARSLLKTETCGMTGYLSKFIPALKSPTKPLTEILDV